MSNLITYKGFIHFDPIDVTKKHTNQSTWKRIAMVMFEGDICEYYSWFIRKRFNIILNKPLRNAHVSFINDSLNDIKIGLNTTSDVLAEEQWNLVKNKWDKKSIDLVFNLDARVDKKHWWLKVDNIDILQNIRNELYLGKPFYSFHMSIGYANEKNIEHFNYILKNIRNFGNEFC